MSRTYTQLLYHVVFSTKHRTRWLAPAITPRLYAYVGGIVREHGGSLYRMEGIEDHVHIYLRWRPDSTVSDMLRTLKAPSSKWIHDTFPDMRAFAWQDGYSAFTVSKFGEEGLKRYIEGQREHHETTGEDFCEELKRLLREHGIEYDERYLFD